jgi:hypothetical protein
VQSIKPKDRELLGGSITINIVCLVRDENDRLAASTQQLCNFCVSRVRTSGCIHQEQNQVGSINRDARLILHPNLNWIAYGGLHAPRVDYAEALPIPLNDADESVTGRTSAILNNSPSLANKAIEECALANVRSPDERN